MMAQRETRAPPPLLPLALTVGTQNRVCAAAPQGTSDLEPFKIPTKLCTCQQNCTDRVTGDLIKKVCVYFKSILERNHQYKYLASLIQCKSKHYFVGGTPDAKHPNATAPSGRRFRQTGFRYYVPVVTDEDLKRQAKARNENQTCTIQSMLWTGPSLYRIVNPIWDHVEVCLRAFITIHLMSEKRVIIARQTRKLQRYIKCTKPLPSHSAELAGSWDDDEQSMAINDEDRECDLGDVLRDVRTWMAEQANRAQRLSYPVNPKTMLPMGLVLPASVTCMPVFPKGVTQQAPKPYPPQDQDRDVDIVSDFFMHQLWKPEYIGGVP